MYYGTLIICLYFESQITERMKSNISNIWFIIFRATSQSVVKPSNFILKFYKWSIWPPSPKHEQCSELSFRSIIPASNYIRNNIQKNKYWVGPYYRPKVLLPRHSYLGQSALTYGAVIVRSNPLASLAHQVPALCRVVTIYDQSILRPDQPRALRGIHVSAAYHCSHRIIQVKTDHFRLWFVNDKTNKLHSQMKILGLIFSNKIRADIRPNIRPNTLHNHAINKFS